LFNVRKNSLLVRAVVILLVLALNLGTFDSLATGVLTGSHQGAGTTAFSRANTFFTSLSYDFQLKWQALAARTETTSLLASLKDSVSLLMKRATADPGEALGANPNPFSSNGGSTTISWRYDLDHDTNINIYAADGSLVYTLAQFFSMGYNSVMWDGTTNSGPAADGTYKVMIVPNDEYAEYAIEISVTVQTERPPVDPPFSLTIDHDTGNVTAKGSADPKSTVNIYINGQRRGSTSGGSWEYNLGNDFSEGQIYSVYITITDPKGKESGPSPEIKFLTYTVKSGELCRKLPNTTTMTAAVAAKSAVSAA